MKPEYHRMSTQIQPPPATTAGFTLIELMIAVAIVGILATIAATSYQSQIQRSRRTDARSALLDLAGREEKLYSTTNAYGATPALLGYGTAGTFPISVGNYYTVDVQVAAGTYVITATPANAQTSDTACTTLWVNQTGAQGSTGSGTTAACWGR
jgi:type IV pilus assembly protein PilE